MDRLPVETIPYPPSALNRLFRAIERLPGGGWWVYPVLLLALVAYYQASLWVLGIRPVGSLAVDGLAGLVYGPFVMAACHYFTRVAGTAMDAFRPASGLGDDAFARRRYELVTLPAGRLWVAGLVGAIIAVGSLLTASDEAMAPYGGTLQMRLVVYGPAAAFGYGMFAVVAYQTARQLVRVDRLHREATAIDLYDTTPIYAFSRVTVQIGIAFVFASYWALLANATFQAGNATGLAVVVGSIVAGAASFIVPLWGIHGRLIEEKATLLRGANLRADSLQTELYRRVDASDLAGVKDVTDALGGIRATRDEVGRLPTWPWPPQVLRGFVTAIVLPVVVFLVTRLAGSLIG